MKQSAVKTLGATAVGVAFAAAAAGTAAAAPAAAPVPELPALTGLTQTTPVQGVTNQLPMGAKESLNAGQMALEKGTSTLRPGGGDPVSGLIGGLPVGRALGSGLPLGG